MGKGLPFDEKNAKDFLENTRKIEEALMVIELDIGLAPSKANLARISGLNRNTLYNRSLMTCPPERKGASNAADFGWPYKKLLEIRRARERPFSDKPAEPTREQFLEERVNQLESQLNKSRYVAGFWFNRTLDLKRERDVARREAELLRKQLSKRSKSYRKGSGGPRKQPQQTIKAVKT